MAVITQTTLSIDDTEASINNIKNSFEDVLIRNDLCYATTNRQNAVKEISKKVEVLLVVGSKNSSNCNRLRDVAESANVRSYLINGVHELNEEWLRGVNNLGITSGASTPEVLVEELISFLNPDEIIPMGGEEENITFKIPESLR